MKRLEQFLFYFLLFAIPFQTRKILWHQNWNFNEWQSISVYGTDLILLILFAFWLFHYFHARKFLISKPKFLNKPQLQNPDLYLLILIAVSAISIKNSTSIILSGYNVLKLIEFVVFYFYIKSYAIYKFGFVRPMIALFCGGLFQAIIAIAQFLKQSSLGLKLFGESILAPNLTGVASFYNYYGVKIMRAYGTTPHPNVLAAYLFLAAFSFYFVYLYFRIYRQNKIYNPKFNIFLLAGYPLLLFAFFFTFARVMIFLWFAGFAVIAVFIFCKRNFKKILASGPNRVKLTKILVTGTVVVGLFGVFYWADVVTRIKISSEDEAVQLRIFYNQESLKAVNWFGVGSGNFVNWLMARDPNLPRYVYQPVHNIYLLIYSENGILAAGAFVIFLGLLVYDFIKKTKMAKFYDYSFLLLFLSFLFMGLFDHFLWTLQQGRLMFWLLCAGLTLLKDGDIISL